MLFHGYERITVPGATYEDTEIFLQESEKGEITGFLRCDREGAFPNPGCTLVENGRYFTMDSSFNRSQMHLIEKIRNRARLYGLPDLAYRGEISMPSLTQEQMDRLGALSATSRRAAEFCQGSPRSSLFARLMRGKTTLAFRLHEALSTNTILPCISYRNVIGKCRERRAASGCRAIGRSRPRTGSIGRARGQGGKRAAWQWEWWNVMGNETGALHRSHATATPLVVKRRSDNGADGP